MRDFQSLIETAKNPKYLTLSIMICLFCMALGFARASLGGLIVGIIMGVFLSFAGMILSYKHEKKQKEIMESLVIPKIGLTERKEQWLRKKKLQELRSEYRSDLLVKIVWWIIFAIIGLNVLYWISPILYNALQISE
jgi:hypothetical protein